MLVLFSFANCSEYSFNELNPFKLLCSGEFDTTTNSCNIDADFPSPSED